MTIIDHVSPTRARTYSLPRTCLSAALLALALAQGALAQTSNSVTDGSTPSALSPGAPAGSYPLSGFENVNLYNGNLSFALPLLQNGGRGAAGAVVTLKVEQHWRVKGVKPPPNCELTNTCEPVLVPDPNAWLGGTQDYGPGTLKGRSGGVTCGELALTRLTFTSGDGTEFELRDQLNEGRPLGFSCNPSQGALRGAVFVTADGTAATFISDTPVYDWTGGAPTTVYPSGVLKLRDGTVYRIDAGKVSWTRDRNGNRVSYTYEGTRVKTITDSLGRVVTINYGVSDVAPYGLCDQIVYGGFGGAQRVVRVSYANLENVLRTNRAGDAPSPRTVAQLFPDLQGSATTAFNPQRKSAVWLPDDGVARRAYKLFYNAYGELARVELPTGGAIEYDFGDYFAHGPDQIFRGVVERRVYSDGTHLEGRTTYTTDAGARTVDALDASGVLLARSTHYFYGTPLTSLAQHPTDYSGWQEGREYKTEYFDVAGGAASALPARRVEQAWRQRAPLSWWSGSADAAPPNDPRVVETVTTLEPGGANLVSKQSALDPQTGAVGFDQFNDQTDAWAYDYGVGATPPRPVTHTHNEYLSSANGVDYVAAGGVHIRGLVSARQVYAVNPADGTETLTAKSETRYDESSFPLLACDPEQSVPCSSVPQWGDPGTSARGNPTTTRSWLDTANAWVETHTQYDQLGNARKLWDARGNLSEMSYKDSFAGTNTAAANTFAFPTKAASAAAQADASVPFGAHQSLVTTTVYDYSSGLPSSTTDANNRTTVFVYAGAGGAADPLDRLKGVVRPDGGRTVYEYGDAAGNLYVRVLTDLDGTRRVESKQFFDGLGRLYRKATFENYDAARPWLNVDKEYDALGRVARSSMPYRAAEGAAQFSTDKWAETTYDALGRVRKVTTRPDGASVYTDFSGDRVLSRDQAGKERVSRTDALGRLTQVWEVTAAESGAEASTVSLAPFPGHAEAAYGYLTSYRYDALGRLRMVEQAGQHSGQPVTQRRFFAYDSLGRVVRARYPEQGLITNPSNDPDFPAYADPVTTNSQWSLAFRYDENGNLLARMDARLVGQPGAQSNLKVRHTYDALNRNVTTDYNDTPALNPDVMRYYDGAAGGLGLPWKSEAAQVSLNTVEQYDAAGRPVRQKQQFWVAGQWGRAYTALLDYNLAGDPKSLVYPSGHKVEYQYEAAGRLGDNGSLPAFKGTLGDGAERTYASQVVYDELGGVNQERFGTAQPVYNKHFYNSRGQLSQIRVSTYAFTDLANRENWNRGALINHYSEQSWAGSGSDNNGDLAKQDVYIPDDDQVSNYSLSTFFYEYDALNRLRRAREGRGGADGWVQSYDYDRWGNRTVNLAGTNGVAAPQFAVDPNTNRLGVPAGYAGQIAFDAAGNMTLDTYQGGQGGGGTRTYDAEGRLTSAQFVSGQLQAAGYAYDADGQRVKRAVGTGEEAWQVYGAGGELLAEYAPDGATASPLKEYGYRAGELLVTAAPAGAAVAPKVNVALASAGASATASTSYSAAFTAAGAIDGEHRGANWGAGGGWNDATNGSYPDWLQVSFGGAKTVDEIDVYTVQDAVSNPSEPTEGMTFSLYGMTSFEVQYWTGSAWATVPGGGVTGNDKVWRRFTFPAVTTTGVRVLVGGALNSFSRVVELEAYEARRANYAASSNGGVATASSTYSAAFPAASVNNGERKGLGWNGGQGGWNDATGDSYPDWVEVAFTGAKQIDEVDVYTLQDNVGSPSEPTEATTFSQYGITSFEVQYWNGSAWATVSGGSVGGNNKVWRKVTFAAVTTSKVRVLVNGALASYSRIVEIEAWGGGGAAATSSGADVRWLVTDQLGTPRMLVDKTGSLAGVSRHDYLPFGEEIKGETAWRTYERGYRGDTTRQKFTGYEHDAGVGLDYAKARYYSAGQGRFTGVDPLAGSAKPAAPQTWNRYAYVLNRPTVAVDPNGLSTIVVVVSPRSNGGDGSASVSVYNRDGFDRTVRDGSNRVEGRAVGMNGSDRTKAGADTPFGVYKPLPNYNGSNANATQGGTAGVAARPSETQFGTGIITMTPVSGEVVDNERSSIYIHGGGRPLAQALDPQQPLTPTQGCVRVHNEDINALITTVNDLATEGDPISNIFIGDAPTLNAMADQKDSTTGEYLYPELRNAGFGSPDEDGNSPGSVGHEKANAPPEGK
ncbi:MAG: discoidin domain-containing protein [Acidobacteria bacterium]|nr:discoidin domain-containing protein [Acidobacteriota bacterium]